jgi:hypothetical protein
VRTISRPSVITLLACACCAVALLAACGSSSGGPSPAASTASPSPSHVGPSPVPSPQITSGTPPAGAIAVVRRYWDLLGTQQYDAAFALTTGPHIANAIAGPKEFESARFLRPVRKVFATPGDDATVEFGSWVHIVPPATGSPFGTAAARWEMFSRVVRMSDGSWRLVEVGTGP